MLRFAWVACAALAAFSVPAQAVTYTTAGPWLTDWATMSIPALARARCWLPASTAMTSSAMIRRSRRASVFIPAAIRASRQRLFDLRSLGSIHSASVYLGSIDTYNFIDVIGRDGAGNLDFSHALLTIGGADLPPSNGDWYDAQTNRRLTLNFGASDNVGALVFRSNGVAFEFDSLGVASHHDVPGNHSTAAVPEPASWAMMVGGFGLAGGVLRRTRRQAVVRLA